jgi:hypothetical protein
MPEPMTEIHGNTFSIREELKALGGAWNAERKCWLVPAGQAGEARRLLRHSTDGYRSPFKWSPREEE